MKKNIFITGASGMLGRELVKQLVIINKYNIFSIGRTQCDLIPKDNNIFFDFLVTEKLPRIPCYPDVIIHSAALTDLKLCENNRQIADKINFVGTKIISQLTESQTKLIYISTDSVFDGRKELYKETDKVNPLNNYAKSKLKGEEVTFQYGKGLNSIIRTNIFGENNPLKNSLSEWAYKEWKNNIIVNGFSDVFFNALHISQLSECILNLIENKKSFSVLNIASDEIVSKYEFLNKMRIKLDVDSKYLNICNSELIYKGNLIRPKNTSLDISLLKTIMPAPSLQKGIDISTNNLKNIMK